MKKQALVIAVGALFALPILSADTVVDEIVARVNNEIITRADYERSRADLLNEDKQHYGADAQEHFDEDEKNVLRDLIDQDLLVEKGRDLGITADTELIKRLDQMRKDMGLSSMDDLEKAARQQGVSFEDFKQNLRNQIITQKVIGQEVGGRMRITESEVQQYYDEHKKDFEHPEQVRLSEILVSTEPPPPQVENAQAQQELAQPSPEQLAAAQQKAQGLLAQIKAGAKFEELAKKSSDGPTAAQGGDLGYFKRGMLAKELEDITFSLPAGGVSDVIRTKQGYVILKVSEHQPPGLPPLKDVESKIQDAIYYQKLQPALRAYLTTLREQAYIDIKPGYVDTAASPNETKPVYVAAAATARKKKKKKHFLLF